MSVFHLEPMGRLGNQMIEYMVALKFADLVGGGCQISNMRLQPWGIDHPRIESPGPVATEKREQHIDLPALAEQVRSGEVQRVEWTGFGQRLENFLPRERYQDVFVSPFSTNLGFGPQYLICPIRAEDILHGPNPDYVLTPVEFYRDIVEMTGLVPVFIGQTEPNAYMTRMRLTFPRGIFRAPQADPLVDFQTIRQSRHVAIGVSTYSWVAAWLSRSIENIYLTVNGLFNPMQNPSVDMLPFGDERYKFYQCPINYAVPLEAYYDVHQRIAPYIRLMPHAMLQKLLAEAPRFPFTLDLGLSVFDEVFYLQNNEDVAAVAATIGPGFGRQHYIEHGFAEDRFPTRFDPVWYARQYPFAAFEMAQGDHLQLHHHYIVVGKARGYRPHPPPQES